MNTTLNYSLNFNVKKRKQKQIKFIIFHYTGMKKETEALKRLINNNSKVSCHYLIKNNGKIVNLVPDLYVAWHAGVSSWKKYKLINKYSIGIEISNPGHDHKYSKYNKRQIHSLLQLSKFLIKKYEIKPNYILGHSDISPDRKKDPGEKFPWRYLSQSKIGYWHGLNQKKLLKERNKKITENDIKNFIKNLHKIGYVKPTNAKKYKYIKTLTIAFQRRFRQDLINGIVDKECLIISKNIANKIL